MVKNPSANAGDSFNPWLGKIPGGGNGNPPQYSCLENPVNRGSWKVTVHRITKSQTPLKWLTMPHTSSLNFSFFVWISLSDFVKLSFYIFLCVNICSSLSFLQTAILNSLWGKSQISLSLGSTVRRLLCSLCRVMFLWFSKFLYICFFDPLYLKWQSLPVVLTDWLWERNPFWWPCKRLWALLRPSMDTPAPCFLLSLWKNISVCDLATH